MLRETFIFLPLISLLYKLVPILYFHITSPDLLYTDSCGLIFNNTPLGTGHSGRTCNDPSFQLLCENNKPVLYLNYGRHFIHTITTTTTPNKTTLQSIIGRLDNNNCSTITLSPLTHHSTNYSSQLETKLALDNNVYYSNDLIFVTCENPVSSFLYTDIWTPCASTGATQRRYSYVLPWYAQVGDVSESCSVDMVIRVLPWGPVSCNNKCRYPEILQSEEVEGIRIKWRANRCGEWEGGDGSCFLDNTTNIVFCHSNAGVLSTVSNFLRDALNSGVLVIPIYSSLLWLAVKFALGPPLVAAFLIYKWKRRDQFVCDEVEDFLQNHGESDEFLHDVVIPPELVFTLQGMSTDDVHANGSCS
ncbi:hypothetical protein RJT34_04521 [Clitoria ternatea]|uniref:Wall-associated receptor kinase galacturonan-binding domain-containing protein n=1 Tax=Clitoria ternatea TaxID=43366 RepID=A0AAN9KNN8_CLITE